MTVALPLYYKIYDGPLEMISDGFEAVIMRLDARQKSDLNWKEAEAIAVAAIRQNLKIFWELKLGLFDQLNSPLSNHPQYLNLKLAIDHFKNVFWSKYAANSVGVCLYRGSANFSESFRWGDKEKANFEDYLKANNSTDEARTELTAQFCQSAAIDYIKLLAEELPDEAEPFALIDISDVGTLAKQAQWQNSELASPLRFALKGSQIPLNHQLVWDEGASPLGYISCTLPLQILPKNPSTAVCIPLNSDRNAEELEKLFADLKRQGIHYRLISEDKLTVEWDQLDDLIVISEAVNPITKRMLLGFCAAGGTVKYLGHPLGLAQEAPFVI